MDSCLKYKFWFRFEEFLRKYSFDTPLVKNKKTHFITVCFTSKNYERYVTSRIPFLIYFKKQTQFTYSNHISKIQWPHRDSNLSPFGFQHSASTIYATACPYPQKKITSKIKPWIMIIPLFQRILITVLYRQCNIGS
jgi:hypothetical protein